MLKSSTITEHDPMRAVHPGRVLRRELEVKNLSANALALALRTLSGRVTDILKGKRAISTDTAMRLGRYFGQSPYFWLNLQTTYDLKTVKDSLGPTIDKEVAPSPAA